MTENVTAWFTERYETKVHANYQQKDRRLGDTVAGGGTFVGDKVYFPRIDAVEAYDSPAFAKLALANAAQDFIELTAKPKFIAFGLWDPHRQKYSIATADEYARQGANSIVRAEDDVIIKVLRDAAANGIKSIGNDTMEQIQTIGAYDSVSTLDDIAEAVAMLGEDEAFDGEDITVVMPFRQKIQFALDPYMVSNDVKENMPWNDLRWRTTQRLPQSADGEGVDLFVYARSAIVSGYNDQMTPINERDGAALTDIIGHWMQVGAAGRNARGIKRIKAKKNFSLYRQPTPVEGLVAAAA